MHCWDCLVVIGMGVLFIVLGFAAIGGAKGEEKVYFDSSYKRQDLRQFLTRWPERPRPRDFRAGGWASVGSGALLVIMGIAFLLWG